MRIYYSSDSEVLCRKYNILNIETLSNSITALAIETCSLIDFENEHIQFICVLNKMDYRGKVHILDTSKMLYAIFLAEEVATNLVSSISSLQIESKSVICHEIYHCKDLTIIGRKIDISTIAHDSHNIDELILNLGYHQWLEYNAHYFSAKYFPCKIRTIDKYPASLINILNNFNQYKIFDHTKSISEYENIIHYFIKDVVKLLANYNSIYDDNIFSTYNQYYNSNILLRRYLENISKILEEYRTNYPYWISYDSFKNIGQNLLTFK